MTSDPTLRPQALPEDLDRALRPQVLEEFVGQQEARANLRVFIESAKIRGESMDHTLFHGPPGLGKTTLAQGLGAGLGVRGPIVSPTFVISRVHRSVTDGPHFVHVDAYRLGDASELSDIDLDASLADSVTYVEWGQGKADAVAAFARRSGIKLRQSYGYANGDEDIAFLRKVGKIILVTTVLLWVLLNLPTHSVGDLQQAGVDPGDKTAVSAYVIDHSYAASVGRGVEPVFEPLGFDWRINVGVIASL